MARVNKEREGHTARFSVRLPKELHSWLKEESNNSETYVSMNRLIEKAVRQLKSK